MFLMLLSYYVQITYIQIFSCRLSCKFRFIMCIDGCHLFQTETVIKSEYHLTMSPHSSLRITTGKRRRKKKQNKNIVSLLPFVQIQKEQYYNPITVNGITLLMPWNGIGRIMDKKKKTKKEERKRKHS